MKFPLARIIRSLPPPPRKLAGCFVCAVPRWYLAASPEPCPWAQKYAVRRNEADHLGALPGNWCSLRTRDEYEGSASSQQHWRIRGSGVRQCTVHSGPLGARVLRVGVESWSVDEGGGLDRRHFTAFLEALVSWRRTRHRSERCVVCEMMK